MTTRDRVTKSGLLLAGLACALYGAAASAETRVETYAGVGYSDNLARQDSDEESESIYAVGANLAWDRQGSRLDGRFTGGFDWYNYSGEAYDDEFLGRANASLQFGIVPERILWVLNDTYGQTTSDPFTPQSPLNRQNVNSLSTGPDFRLRLGDTGYLTLGGRYNDVSYETSVADYDGWSASLTMGRNLSAASKLQLVAGRTAVRYDLDFLFPEYDRDQAYLTYIAQGARTALEASAGWSRIERADETDTSPLFDVSVSRDVSARSKLTLSGSYGLSTGGEVFEDLVGDAAARPDTDGTTGVGDYAEQTTVRLGWNTQWARTAFDAGVSYGQEDYAESDTLDVTRQGISLGLRRDFTQSLTGSFSVGFGTREFDLTGDKEDETFLSINLRQRLGRTLAVGLMLTREERKGDGALADYEENRAFLRLYWTPIGSN